jgi:hypothetical protein
LKEWERVGPYPNTCENCDYRGQMEYSVFGYFPENEYFQESQTYFTDDGGLSNTYVRTRERYKMLEAPKRCNPCHAKAECYRKANNTLKKLEHIRDLLETNDDTRYHNNGWQYLKFVTLTWKNEFQLDKDQLSKKELASARLSLRRKRDKIAEILHVAGGTDVMENVKTKIYGCYPDKPDYQQEYTRHHLHTHGVWIMPYHPIKKIGETMRKYVGRDTVRAIRPKSFYSNRLEKVIEISAMSRARKYLMKYLTKEKGLKRGNWGLARGVLCEARFCEFLFRETSS